MVVEEIPILKEIIAENQELIDDMADKLTGLEFILTEIAVSPMGAWNNDPVAYRENVIKWCQDRAKEGLALIHRSASKLSDKR